MSEQEKSAASFLGLDLGTSGLRGLLIAADGTVLCEGQAAYPTTHEHSGWSEQNPEDWTRACETVIDAIHLDAPEAFARLAGIGVSGHMHGAVLLGKNNAVLRPCIMWNDTRSFAEAEGLDAVSEVRRLSGNIVFPGFTAPKLLWVAKHEPQIFEQIETVLLPKDYVNLWLSDHLGSDISDAAGTSWLDVGARHWSKPLLAQGQMRADQMPPLVEGSDKMGELRSELAKAWGLSHPVIVAGGAADNAAAACGAGVLAEGDGFVSLGTSGVLLTARERFSPAPETAVHSFCHAVPERWYQMGVILSATDSLNWWSNILGQTPQQATTALGNTLTVPTPIKFLPYLSGERTPHNDAHIRGSFLGLEHAHSRDDLTKAILQGVAFALRDCLEALRKTGADPKQLLALGGGSKSSYWVSLCATVLNLPLSLPEKGELGAALGAARLAICAATAQDAETIMSKPKISQVVAPVSNLTQAYDAAYQNWRAAYPAIKDIP